jgi:hypothetical protein
MKVDPALFLMIQFLVACMEPGVWPVAGRDWSPARLARFKAEARAILVGDSGNGAHLVYPLEMENTPENAALLQAVLQTLTGRYGPRFQDLDLELDQTVKNPARLSKVYGTVAGKGEWHRWRQWHSSGSFLALILMRVQRVGGSPYMTKKTDVANDKEDINSAICDKQILEDRES